VRAPAATLLLILLLTVQVTGYINREISLLKIDIGGSPQSNQGCTRSVVSV